MEQAEREDRFRRAEEAGEGGWLITCEAAGAGTHPDAPVVVDLDDGVTYGQHWHFLRVNEVSVGRPLKLPAEVRTDLPVAKTVRGRVTSTQVAWIVVGHPFPQTTLFFEAFPSS